jgi:hypothetical protein
MPERKPVQSSELLGSEDLPSANVNVSHEDIARLAYALWEERAGAEGSPEQDWLEAERKLKQPKAQTQAA